MDALVFVLGALEEAVMVHNQDKVLEQADKLFTLSAGFSSVFKARSVHNQSHQTRGFYSRRFSPQRGFGRRTEGFFCLLASVLHLLAGSLLHIHARCDLTVIGQEGCRC